MKVNMRIALIAFAVVLGTAMLARQSQPQPAKSGGGAKSAMMGEKMADRCKRMMAMHEQVMADMKTMDASLDQKVAAMNAAKGTAKVDATAAAVTEMASQRKQMTAKMAAMRDQMMAHMDEHMAQSGGAAMRHSMAQCPMMQGMAH